MPPILQFVQGPEFSQAEWTFMFVLLFSQLASAYAVTAIMKRKFHETNKWAGLLIFLAAFLMAALQTVGIFFSWRLSEIDTAQWKVIMAFNAVLCLVPIICAASYTTGDVIVVVLLFIADGLAWTNMGLVSEIDVSQTVWIYYMFLGLGYLFLAIGAILYAIFGTAPVSSPEYNRVPQQQQQQQPPPSQELQHRYTSINMPPNVRYDLPPRRYARRPRDRDRPIRSESEISQT